MGDSHKSEQVLSSTKPVLTGDDEIASFSLLVLTGHHPILEDPGTSAWGLKKNQIHIKLQPSLHRVNADP